MLLALAACNSPAPPPAASSRPPAPTAPAGSASAHVTLDAPANVPSSPSASDDEPVPASQPASAAPSASKHYRVAAIGDSLTDPRSHGGRYLEYLRARCPTIEIDNFGKGGAMVNQMRRSFDVQVAASSKPYTHLLVFGGVNDLYSDLTAFRTPAKIEADLGRMYAWGRAHGVKVVALTVAPWGGFTRYFNPARAEATRTVNAWIREQAKQGQIAQVVDAYALLSCGDPERLCDRYFEPFKDGLHFGPEGHERLGQAVFQAAFADCE